MKIWPPIFKIYDLKFLILLLVTLLAFETGAQNKIDSLKLALKTAAHDTIRCLILSELSESAPDDEWPAFNEQLISLIENKISASKYPAREKDLYRKYYAGAMNNRGYFFQTKGRISQAIEAYEKSLKISELISDKQNMAATMVNLGYNYQSQGDLDKGLEYYTRSLAIQKETGDRPGMAHSYINIGFTHHMLKDTEKALEYYLKSLEIRKEINDKSGMAYCLNNIGGIYSEKKEYDSALVHFGKSLKIRKEIGEKTGIANSMTAMGTVYYSMGRNEKDPAARLTQLKKAENFCLEGLRIGQESGMPKLIKNASDKLRLIYKATGDFKNALNYSELFIRMRDSISNQETRKAAIKSQLKYEYEKQAAADSVSHAKESEIKNAEIAKQTAEIKAKKNQQYALFGGLALVIIFAGFMYNRFKITQRQKGIIELQKTEVEDQKKLVEMKQKEIVDSINYARRIQLTQIPNEMQVFKMLQKFSVKGK